ncbi:MAG: DUF2332 family protein [Parvibaculum sp.]|uniref:DUF2332 domain-containing protein n=1 Tax=Parvibaculum sp. TaxID=2024848 RepID=UPI0025F6BA9E|nr:DUF2332 family protein [Parvibaculum sp.]MCE9649597.1 DUF2332 family protein [Parvibaculum sp.]
MHDHIRQDFRRQSLACNALGSPFTGRVCALLAERLTDDTAFGHRLLNWQGHPQSDALPLRAAGALNAMNLSGRHTALSAAYPPHDVDDETLWSAIAQATDTHDAFLAGFLDSPPQTNEVARSGSLLGGALHLAAMMQLPIDLYEIGSSAGLNLGLDRYAYNLGGKSWGRAEEGVHIEQQWAGALPPLDAPLTIRSRHACDRNPLDPSSEETRERLLAYCWPDQTARKERLAAALASAARSGFRVENADAADWAERHFANPGKPGGVRLLMHSIVWQYLPAEVAGRIAAAMEKAGAAATPDAPVAWLRVEPESNQAPTAAVKLTLWPTGETRTLGQADFHGRFAQWI